MHFLGGRVSETAEWIWLRFCTGMEVCPGHSVGGDCPRGPTRGAAIAPGALPGEPKIQFSYVDSVSLCQTLFHTHSLDGSTYNTMGETQFQSCIDQLVTF